MLTGLLVTVITALNGAAVLNWHITCEKQICTHLSVSSCYGDIENVFVFFFARFSIICYHCIPVTFCLSFTYLRWRIKLKQPFTLHVNISLLSNIILLSVLCQGVPGPGQYHIRSQFEKPLESCGNQQKFSCPFLSKTEVHIQNTRHS